MTNRNRRDKKINLGRLYHEMGLPQVLDFVLEALEPLHRLVVLVLQKLEVVTEADLKRIILRTKIEAAIRRERLGTTIS